MVLPTQCLLTVPLIIYVAKNNYLSSRVVSWVKLVLSRGLSILLTYKHREGPVSIFIVPPVKIGPGPSRSKVQHSINEPMSSFKVIRERSSSEVECLSRERGAADSNLTGVTALCP